MSDGFQVVCFGAIDEDRRKKEICRNCRFYSYKKQFIKPLYRMFGIFYIKDECPFYKPKVSCDNMIDSTSACEPERRKDGRNVIFIETTINE